MRLDSKNRPTPIGRWPKRDLAEGVSANRWTRDVDEIRTAIGAGPPVVIGVPWYSDFDKPEKVSKEYWIGRQIRGHVRGGHAVCLYGASDRRQAVRIKNSWGEDFPLTWMPYTTLERVLAEAGEATISTDR